MNAKQKIRYEELKVCIESKGGFLITEFYLDHKTSFMFNCGYCNSDSNCTFHKTMQRDGYCSNCRYERSTKKMKKSQSDVEKEFLENGVLLIGDYVNSKTPVNIRCNCGNDFKRAYAKIVRDGYCCLKCKDAEKASLHILEMSEYISSKECKVVGVQEYRGLLTRFNFKCKCGNLDDKTFRVFRENPSCSSCTSISGGKKRSMTNSKVREIVQSSSDCLLISEDYESRDSQLLLKCSCSNEFFTYIDRFLHENKRQCNECGVRMRSGENNPMWKGGVTSENGKIRYSKDYKQWRLSVFERDGFTCQCCNDDTGGNLEAHHIENFSENLDKVFNINNGITLCKRCHSPSQLGSFHHTYSSRDNDKYQLQEYFNDIRSHLNLPLISIASILN